MKQIDNTKFCAKLFSTAFGRTPEDQWLLAIEASGHYERLRELMGMPPDITLEEASTDDLSRLGKIRLKAMENGMRANNAQMVRAFNDYEETKIGERQLQGIVIHVTPKSVPDKMSKMLHEKMKELTEIANRN